MQPVLCIPLRLPGKTKTMKILLVEKPFLIHAELPSLNPGWYHINSKFRSWSLIWKKPLLRKSQLKLYKYVRRSCIFCCRHITSVVEPSWFVSVPVMVPVPTLEKFWFRFRFQLRLPLRFRILIIFSTIFQARKNSTKSRLFYVRSSLCPRKLTSLLDF